MDKLKSLNEKYNGLDIHKRVEQLYKDFEEKDIMLTSAFAATSAFLLKVFSDVNQNQVIYFINTGFHFPETIIYKDYLTKLYQLKVVDLIPEGNEHQLSRTQKLWASNPDRCCEINKVAPINLIKSNYKIWVSGLMKWQSDFRSTLDIFELKNGITKFYPLLDIGFEQRDEFIMKHHLPFHPLKSKGYNSIGCTNCTVPAQDRAGRWNNSPKTECGLHL